MLFDSVGIREVYLCCIITFYCFLLSPLFSFLFPSCSQWEKKFLCPPLQYNKFCILSLCKLFSFELKLERHGTKAEKKRVELDSEMKLFNTLFFFYGSSQGSFFFSMSNWSLFPDISYQSELTIIYFLQTCVVIFN